MEEIYREQIKKLLENTHNEKFLEFLYSFIISLKEEFEI